MKMYAASHHSVFSSYIYFSEMSSMAFDCERVEGPILHSLMADLIL